jgi:ubiquinone/menaquinone biosynthesis C-methylase UbiE
MPSADARAVSWEGAVEWLRKQPDKQDLVRASYFDDPLLAAAERFAASDEWQATLAELPEPPGGKALDLGAGRGISSFALARAGWLVSALEPDPSGVVGANAIRALTEESKLPITVFQTYAENLPFPDAHFDLVYGRQVLHHARDLEQLCREVFRVLKPGGTFMATREHVIDNREASLQAFLERHPLHQLYGGENAFLLKEYDDAISTAGLDMIKRFRPYETAINFSEPSRAQQHEKYRMALASVAGRGVSSVIWRVPFVREPLVRTAAWVLNNFSRYPGRLFSFVAKKPGR